MNKTFFLNLYLFIQIHSPAFNEDVTEKKLISFISAFISQ